MKVIIITVLVVFTAVFCPAQDHRAMMNKTWDLINTKTYKPDKSGKYLVYFPPALKALDKKQVELPGYIIPVKTGMVHNLFLLAVLPVSQCQFCGQGDVPSMVEVNMVKPINYTEKPVTITGVLNLNTTNPDRPEFILTKSTLKENGL